MMSNSARHSIVRMNRKHFRHFELQKPAQDHAKVNPGFRVFVRESFSTDPRRKSSRKFITGDLTKFLLAYYDVEDEIKNFYEVITEGHPCRLYFDLEFARNENMNIDEDEVTLTFINVINHCLKVKFSVLCDEDCVLQLESSPNLPPNPPRTKMSRHLIFHVPNHVFANNSVCGHFVRSVWTCLVDFLDNLKVSPYFPHPTLSREALGQLRVSCRSKLGFIADMSVYSKNRHFRLLLSRKWEEESFLAVSLQNSFPNSTSPITSLEQSLVCCSVPPNTRVLQWNEERINTERAPRPGAQYQEAPLPRIDMCPEKLKRLKEFVGGCARTFSPSATVALYKMEPGRVTFTVVGDNFCELIGRRHKNNRTYFVADLRNKWVRQGCFDRDCLSRMRERETIKLPDDANPDMH